MEVFDITCVKSEVIVKQEEDWAEEYGAQTNDEQNKYLDDEGNFLPKKIKCEVESDDENNTKPILDNVQCDNSQNLPGSECNNMYDDVSGIIKVEIEISERLDSVGSKTASETNDESNEASIFDDIRLSKSLLVSNPIKKVKLNDDTRRRPKRKPRKLLTSEHLNGTDPAAALHKEGTSFSCPQCKYTTIKKKHLEAHLRTHFTEKPLVCDQCNFICAAQCHLKQHMLTHTDEKPFECDKCNFKCRQKGSLKRHLLTHSGQKPFSCYKCDYKCKQKELLKRHLFIHMGEKPFACDKCNYKCVQNSDMKRHLLTHTGHKPFSCNKCYYKCRRNSDMKRHLLTHACQKPLSCDKDNCKCYDKFWFE